MVKSDDLKTTVPAALLHQLCEAAIECAEELEAEVEAKYPEPSRTDQPVYQRRYARDIAIVHKTTDLAARLRALC